jgi:hypothetical protein
MTLADNHDIPNGRGSALAIEAVQLDSFDQLSKAQQSPSVSFLGG